MTARESSGAGEGQAGGDKASLRRALRRRLRALSPADLRAGGAEIVSYLHVDAAWSAARVVAAFVSLEDELDTRPLLEAAHGAGKTLLLPRCVSDSRLEFAAYAAGDDLVPGRFGLLEPATAMGPSDIGGADLVFVPGLAFDARGGRLGRGAGYYDRALQPLRGEGHAPTLIGLCHDVQVEEAIPMTARDVGVDRVLTEAGWL